MREYNVILDSLKPPEPDCPSEQVELTDTTICERKEKLLHSMRAEGLDQLVIYADMEHGANFEYLVGFLPRFEEAVLILNQDGSCALILGNENLNKGGKARIAAQIFHAPQFSLPNQPRGEELPLADIFRKAGIRIEADIGLVGWKLFTNPREDRKHMFDIPGYILQAVQKAGTGSRFVNATEIFVGRGGARTTNNANEAAHYEFAAALASDCMLDAMNQVEIGTPEWKLGEALLRRGQHTSLVTIAASGPRFVRGNMYPTTRTVKLGDAVSLTVGYRGGCSSRCAIAVRNAQELPEGQKDYLQRMAMPYFAAYAAWMENIRIGMRGGEMFSLIDRILPHSKYGWSLCPGHLTAEEEWMSSPIYENSEETLQSGMLLQIDIIPSVPGYTGTCAEGTVLLADSELKAQIRKHYPDLWERTEKRRRYIRRELKIDLSEELLPMGSTVAYLRPFLLAKEKALCLQK